MRQPASVLPKALRRAGERPLAVAWSRRRARRIPHGQSSRRMAFIHRSAHQHIGRLVKIAQRAAKAARR